MPWHSITVVTGIQGVWCHDSRTLRVRFLTEPALIGPRSALNRSAYSISLASGADRRMGAPYILDGYTYDILLPFDLSWPQDDTITVTVSADSLEDVNGAAYTAPGTKACRSVPEVRPVAPTEAPLLPREDFATDRTTGGLIIQGGTWAKEFGRAQVLKVLERSILDRPPHGLGFRKAQPLRDADLQAYRVRLRQILGRQRDVSAVRANVSFDRSSGILTVDAAVRTPQGWESLTFTVEG